MKSESLSSMPQVGDGKYLNILMESKGKIKKAKIDEARIQLIRDQREWLSKFLRPYAELLNNLPNVNIDVFFEKYKSDESQIAKWSKEDPFNSFIMGYALAVRDMFFGTESFQLHQTEKDEKT